MIGRRTLFLFNSALKRRETQVLVSKQLWGKSKEDEKKEVELDKDLSSTIPVDRSDKPHVIHKDVIALSKHFEKVDKDKESFLYVVKNFNEVTVRRTGHAEFIYGAMRCLKDFGVHRDLDVYKALMNVFPKDRMVARNFFQEMSFFYPKQQQCAITLLDEMEYNGVIPDRQMEELIISIFGKRSRVWRKLARQFYWFSKIKNASPFPIPEKLPDDALELAKLAIKRMSLDLQSEISVFSTSKIEDCVDKTWIVSSQSPSQREMISRLKEGSTVYVHGPFRIWLKYHQVAYFVLRGAPSTETFFEVDDDPLDVYRIPLNVYGGKSKKEALTTTFKIHEQPEGDILAMSATGTTSRDSVLSWIRILQSFNPNLKNLQVVFQMKGPPQELVDPKQQHQSNVEKEQTETSQ